MLGDLWAQMTQSWLESGEIRGTLSWLSQYRQTRIFLCWIAQLFPRAHCVRISHDWFPSSGTVKISEHLAFFNGDCIRARKQLTRFKFKFIGSV